MQKRYLNKLERMIEKNEKIFVTVMMITASFLLAQYAFRAYPLHTTTDELGAIVGAATVAGYDWSGVIDRSGYYGFGFYILFFPLFYMKLSPILIYRIILVTTRILRGSIISGIAYYIGKQFYKFKSKLNLFLVSIICTIPLHSNDDANIINDVVLDVFLWMIILTICKIVEYANHGKKCMKWILIYLFISFWSLFLHTRAIIMIIASGIVFMGLFVYTRKKRILSVFAIIPLIKVANIWIQKYQNYIWDGQEGLANTSASFYKELSVFDKKTWEVWFHMLVGHVGVQTLLTGGLFLLAIVVFIKYICDLLFKRKNGDLYLNIVLAMSILCMGGALAAFFMSSWFAGMYTMWDIAEKGKVYTYKAMTYVRYWNVFSMPFLFSGVYLAEKKENKDCIEKAMLSGIVLMYFFVKLIIPIVRENASSAGFLYTYLTDRTEKINAEFYYKCIVICVSFICIAYVLYHGTNIKRYVLVPIFFLMVWGYNQANENYNLKMMEKASNLVMASYQKKCVLEENGIKIGKIYAVDERTVDRNWYLFSVLQFYFYEYRIETEYPEVMNDNDIIITVNKNDNIEKDFPMINCYQLDENEVWYTKMELGEFLYIEE